MLSQAEWPQVVRLLATGYDPNRQVSGTGVDPYTGLRAGELLYKLRNTKELFKDARYSGLQRNAQEAQRRAESMALQRQQTEAAIRELENAARGMEGGRTLQDMASTLRNNQLGALADEARKARQQAQQAQKRVEHEQETREAEALLGKFYDKQGMKYYADLYNRDDPRERTGPGSAVKTMERAAHAMEKPRFKTKEELVEDARQFLRALKHAKTLDPLQANQSAANAYFDFMMQSGQWGAGSQEAKMARRSQAGLGPVLEPVLTALKGSEVLAKAEGKKFKVDWGGFGRTKEYDPLLDKTYDVESGERAPGMRGGGGWYTPEEMQQIQERLSHRASLSGLEQEALRRVQQAGSRAVRTPSPTQTMTPAAYGGSWGFPG
jgi:hypothetical protein